MTRPYRGWSWRLWLPLWGLGGFYFSFFFDHTPEREMRIDRRLKRINKMLDSCLKKPTNQ